MVDVVTNILKAIDNCTGTPTSTTCLDCMYSAKNDAATSFGDTTCRGSLLRDAAAVIKKLNSELESEKAKYGICAEVISRQDEELEKLHKQHRLNLLKQLDVKEQIEVEAIKKYIQEVKDYYLTHKAYDRPNAHTQIGHLFFLLDEIEDQMFGGKMKVKKYEYLVNCRCNKPGYLTPCESTIQITSAFKIDSFDNLNSLLDSIKSKYEFFSDAENICICNFILLREYKVKEDN